LQSHLRALEVSAASNTQRRKAVVSNPFYWKANSITLEFRDYLEGLPPERRKFLETHASEFVKEFGRPNPKLSTLADRELLKEKARLVSVHAYQLCRERRHDEAERAIKSAKGVVLKLRKKGTRCNAVMGALFYAESKLLRDRGQYSECEKRLSKAIGHYSVWVIDNPDDPKNIQKNIRLASYKIATFLGDIAWCKNSRGFCTEALALINAARLLIFQTGWELDKASLDVIYADVVRASARPGAKRLKEAETIVRKSYETFQKYSHERMMSRTAFALALLNYYGDELHEAEKNLEEVERFSGQAGDTKWLVNCWNLTARIRIKQEKADEALSLLSKSIAGAEREKLKNQLVVANIVKAEAHCALENYEEAIQSLNKARKENEKRIGAGEEASVERNEGWILLTLADTHLSNDNFIQAKDCLERGERLNSVRELKWLQDKAKHIRQALAARSPKTENFTITNNPGSLIWEEYKDDLAVWLMNQAKLRKGAKGDKEIAAMLGRSTRWIGQVRGRMKKRKKPLT
jgi:tetratricopeptide (TPR) repeat protein